MNKKDVVGGFLGGLLGAAMLKQVYSNDDQETRTFAELILSSDSFTADEIHNIEDFLRFLLNHDKDNCTERFKQFRHYVVGGVNGSSESFQPTVEFLKRIVGKPTNDDRVKICETYAIWKDTVSSQLNRAAAEISSKYKKIEDARNDLKKLPWKGNAIKKLWGWLNDC